MRCWPISMGSRCARRADPAVDGSQEKTMTRQHAVTRRSFGKAAFASAAAFGLPGIAHAQAYPSRPVRVVLPFAAGGVADVTSRLGAREPRRKPRPPVVARNT